VRILRDRFNVPHIRGNSREDVVWAMGWVLQQDRGLLLAQGRNPGRIAALDVPGISAFGLVQNLVPFKASAEADRLIVREQERNLRASGRDGRAIIRETDVFVAASTPACGPRRATSRSTPAPTSTASSPWPASCSAAAAATRRAARSSSTGCATAWATRPSPSSTTSPRRSTPTGRTR
jgi:hypothetical protein